jgi:hypothetical protein
MVLVELWGLTFDYITFLQICKALTAVVHMISTVWMLDIITLVLSGLFGAFPVCCHPLHIFGCEDRHWPFSLHLLPWMEHFFSSSEGCPPVPLSPGCTCYDFLEVITPPPGPMDYSELKEHFFHPTMKQSSKYTLPLPAQGELAALPGSPKKVRGQAGWWSDSSGRVPA